MAKTAVFLLLSLIAFALLLGCTQNQPPATISQGTPQGQPQTQDANTQTGGDNVAASQGTPQQQPDTNAQTGGENLADGRGGTIAKKGDVVQVDYIGKLTNGTVFDTSIKQVAIDAGIPQRDKYEPLEFTVGAGQMIAGFDAAVVGMKEGEEKTVTIPPEKAYGMPNKDMILPVDVSALGENVKVGDVFQDSVGTRIVVTEIKDGKAYIDFNHPLAGKTLVFYIKLIKVN